MRSAQPRNPSYTAVKREVQCGQRVARSGTAEKRYRQSLVVGLAGAGALFKRFTCRIMNTANATMRKSRNRLNIAFRKVPGEYKPSVQQLRKTALRFG